MSAYMYSSPSLSSRCPQPPLPPPPYIHTYHPTSTYFILDSLSETLSFSDKLQLALDTSVVRKIRSQWQDLSGNDLHHNLQFSHIDYTTNDGVQAFCGKAETRGGPGEIIRIEPGKQFTYGPEHTMIAWAKLGFDGTYCRTLWRPAKHHVLVVGCYGDDKIGMWDNDCPDGRWGCFKQFGDADAKTLGLDERWAMWTVVAKNGASTFYYDDAQGGYQVDFTVTGIRHDRLFFPGQPFGCVASAYAWDKAFSADEVARFYQLTKNTYR